MRTFTAAWALRFHQWYFHIIRDDLVPVLCPLFLQHLPGRPVVWFILGESQSDGFLFTNSLFLRLVGEAEIDIPFFINVIL